MRSQVPAGVTEDATPLTRGPASLPPVRGPRGPCVPEGTELPAHEGRLCPPPDSEDDGPVRRLHREHDEQEVSVQREERGGPPQLPDRGDDPRACEGTHDDPRDEGVD